jgi:Xaa-Pro aminopeptidase
MKNSSRLIISSSESSADLLYATRFQVNDEIVWFSKGNKSYGLFNALEIDRAKQQANIDNILSLESFKAEASKLSKTPTLSHYAAAALKKNGIKNVYVPYNFSLGHAEILKKSGIKIVIAPEGLFFPEREFKTEQEIKHLAEAERITEAGMYRAFDILKQSKIGKDKIVRWGNAKLTSEILRGEIDATILKLGGLAKDTIVASGIQGCDPHNRGTGPIKANESLIIDIFPRIVKTGYFGDLTRTVVKGKASEKFKEIWNLVAQAKASNLKKAKAGVEGLKLHQESQELFRSNGYPTEIRKGRWVGFFHGTGHGVGLEIHETPRFQKTILKENQAVTIEPGLYYPGIGGVRLEDLVIIKKNGVKNLTSIPQFIEIK